MGIDNILSKQNRVTADVYKGIFRSSNVSIELAHQLYIRVVKVAAKYLPSMVHITDITCSSYLFALSLNKNPFSNHNPLMLMFLLNLSSTILLKKVRAGRDGLLDICLIIVQGLFVK